MYLVAHGLSKVKSDRDCFAPRAKLLEARKQNCETHKGVVLSRLAGPLPQNLMRCPRALSGCAFHKALELDRAMFAREVNGSLAHALVAAEVSILPHAPAGVTAQKIGVAGRVAQRRPAGIV